MRSLLNGFMNVVRTSPSGIAKKRNLVLKPRRVVYKTGTVVYGLNRLVYSNTVRRIVRNSAFSTFMGPSIPFTPLSCSFGQGLKKMTGIARSMVSAAAENCDSASMDCRSCFRPRDNIWNRNHRFKHGSLRRKSFWNGFAHGRTMHNVYTLICNIIIVTCFYACACMSCIRFGQKHFAHLYTESCHCHA